MERPKCICSSNLEWTECPAIGQGCYWHPGQKSGLAPETLAVFRRLVGVGVLVWCVLLAIWMLVH